MAAAATRATRAKIKLVYTGASHNSSPLPQLPQELDVDDSELSPDAIKDSLSVVLQDWNNDREVDHYVAAADVLCVLNDPTQPLPVVLLTASNICQYIQPLIADKQTHGVVLHQHALFEALYPPGDVLCEELESTQQEWAEFRVSYLRTAALILLPLLLLLLLLTLLVLLNVADAFLVQGGSASKIATSQTFTVRIRGRIDDAQRAVFLTQLILWTKKIIMSGSGADRTYAIVYDLDVINPDGTK